jgi:hypothetical protein
MGLDAQRPREPLPKSRITHENGSSVVEFGYRWEDGYRVLVEWDEGESLWLATLSGLPASIGGSLAYGITKEHALSSLCCALAATIDCLYQVVSPASPSAESPGAEPL